MVVINNDHVAKGFWSVRTVLHIDLGNSCTNVYITICYSLSVTAVSFSIFVSYFTILKELNKECSDAPSTCMSNMFRLSFSRKKIQGGVQFHLLRQENDFKKVPSPSLYLRSVTYPVVTAYLMWLLVV